MQDRQGRTAEIRIRNVIEDISRVADFVEAFGRSNGIPPSVVNDLNVCLDELLNNTISYGYEDHRDHSILVTVTVSGIEVLAEIEDDGRPFDPRQAATPDLAGDLRSRKVGGVGIHFVNSLMDTVDYIRSGRYNRLTLRKRLRI